MTPGSPSRSSASPPMARPASPSPTSRAIPTDARYVVTFERQKTILQAIFTERAPFIKRLIAKIVGFDGAYHRFTGKVTIEKFAKDLRVEISDDHAIRELMYFGKARPPGESFAIKKSASAA